MAGGQVRRREGRGIEPDGAVRRGLERAVGDIADREGEAGAVRIGDADVGGVTSTVPPSDTANRRLNYRRRIVDGGEVRVAVELADSVPSDAV